MKPAEDFAAALRRFLEEAKRHAVKWASLTREQQQAYVVDQIRSFVGEVNGAYLEQRSGLVNHRLTADDAKALQSNLAWREYSVAIEAWRRDPENDAAWQINERQPAALTDPDRDRLKSQPKKPEQPRAVLPSDCPGLPTIERPQQWDILLAAFLNARRGNR